MCAQTLELERKGSLKNSLREANGLWGEETPNTFPGL